MKAFVINLDASPERWAAISAGASDKGVHIERIPAVDGKSLTPAEIKARRAKSFLNHQLSASELGCFLSHRKVWENIAAGPDKYGAVFEDDVSLSAGLSAFLLNGDWIPPDADIVRLETFLNSVAYARRPAALHEGRGIYAVHSSSLGAAGYVISRACAARLAAKLRRTGDAVDEMLFHRRSPFFGTLRIYQVDPALCVQRSVVDPGDRAGDSSIETGRRAAKKNGAAKFRHELVRMYLQVRYAHKAMRDRLKGGERRVVEFK